MTQPFAPDTPAGRDAGLRRDTEMLRRRAHGPWHYIGEPGEAPYQNGSTMAPTAEIPDPVPLRYRQLLGGGLEIQGDVTGVEPGDIVFTLPEVARLDHDVPFSGHDDQGNYVACRLYANGDFVFGVA